MKQLKLILILCLLLLPQLQPLQADTKPVVYFGVIPRYNPIIMYRSYQPMMDYLTANTPYRFELKLSRDYHLAVDFLQNGTTPIASLGPVTFSEAYRKFGAIPIVAPLSAKGVPYYHSIIVVREDSPITSLEELKGKSFAFGDHHSTSGKLIPHHMLVQKGIQLSDLESYSYYESHDATAKAVLKGNAVAGAVKDVVAYRYREHGLRFLAVSDPMPAVPIVVRKDEDPHLVAAMKEALLAIDPSDPRTKQHLIQWDPEFAHGFVSVDIDDYRDIIELTYNNKTGCGLGCH